LKNVIHCITTIERGGAENQLYVLVKEQLKAGMKVSIVYLKGRPDLKEKLVATGAEVLDILHNKNLILQIYFLRKYLKNRRVIIHAHLPRAELISYFASSGKIFIISRHNSEKFFPKSLNFISRFLSLFITKKIAACIAISDAVKTYILDKKEIASADKISVVHYAYNDEFVFQPNLVKKNRSYTIGTIARLVPQKDHKTLFSAFSQFLKVHPDSKLILVGCGDLKSYLVEVSKEFGIFEKITWVDKTDDPYRYLYQMDLFVLPSKYEGFGLVLLEAMQAHVPIIAANNSSIPEVLGKNYVGLFETGNVDDLFKIMFLFFNTSLKFDLPALYAKKLKEFEPKLMLEKILCAYDSVQSNKI
jgi:glycosyltransferase involved in cell wall biosynthesis